jgi:hypothetical protein
VEHAQRAAARIVRRVLVGSTLPVALAASGASVQDDRALVQELAYGTLRFLGQLRAVVRHLADRPLPDASVEALLWVALYQLIHTSAPQPRWSTPRYRRRRESKEFCARADQRHPAQLLRRRDALLAAIRAG